MPLGKIARGSVGCKSPISCATRVVGAQISELPPTLPAPPRRFGAPSMACFAERGGSFACRAAAACPYPDQEILPDDPLGDEFCAQTVGATCRRDRRQCRARRVRVWREEIAVGPLRRWPDCGCARNNVAFYERPQMRVKPTRRPPFAASEIRTILPC
jgi:hypothetical protein